MSDMINNIIKSRSVYFAWLTAALFFFYQYVLRVSPGVMHHELRTEFLLTAQQFASLGSIYLLAYSILQIPLGVLMDKYGAKIVILEKEWFKNLISVQGVGAKLAIAILGVFRTNDLQNAIITEDKLKFQSISGVGGKIATRIINELKNKIKTIKELNIVNAQLNRVDCDIHQKQALDDAIEALVGLGFSKSDAMKRIAGIDTNNKDFTLESLIKKALKSNIH